MSAKHTDSQARTRARAHTHTHTHSLQKVSSEEVALAYNKHTATLSKQVLREGLNAKPVQCVGQRALRCTVLCILPKASCGGICQEKITLVTDAKGRVSRSGVG